MNRLAGRLAAAIVLSTLLAVGVVALIANRTTTSEFRRYLSGSQTEALRTLAPALAAYYQRAGTWQGVDALLSEASVAFGQARGGRGRGPGAPQGRGPALLLADAQGVVVYDSQSSAVGEQLKRSELALAIPVRNENQTVGYLLLRHGSASALAGLEQEYLNRINRALVLAAALALVAGGALGVLLARTLAAPLSRLSAAAQAIAAGDLSSRAPEEGTVETRAVARSFNAMAEHLEQAEQQRRNLMADIAHELRTPLTVVQGNLQALLEGVYPLEREEIATVYDETRLLSRLVDDLRELALAEAGQLRLAPQPTDVAALVQQTVEGFVPLAHAKDIALQVQVAPDAPQLAMADPDRTAQVLRNLLANALRHTPPQGRVTVEVQPAQPNALRVVVADTGPGIPPDELPHVFDRFWSRSRDAGSPGSGLGLAIARSLVRAQGGDLQVASAAGQGARFWFTLPVAS